MSVAALNVEIRTQLAPLQKGLRQAERDLKAFGRSMTSLGNQLSLAVTLPLGAIGVSAIKAAGEMEALRLAMRATFEGAGRSIKEADAELEALRKSALAPGLDFEQAVRGSVRLQNVGYTAEKARGIIEQLANTVATTGGTADDLNEVVNQFSQMIGKGKIFQDDLKIITGRMPKVAQLMKEAFGTTTAEGLNKLGIDARTFVDVITKKMQEMPRVSGGISNAIVNAWSAVRFSLAKVGEEINKTFNVSGKLDQFATWVTGLADGFAGLSDTMKSVILGTAVFVAAVGPMVRLVGFLGTGIMAVKNAFTSLQIAFQTIQASGIIGWWKGLKTVMQANVIGATIAVVLALAAAFQLLKTDMSAQAQAARAVEHANEQAANAVAMETVNAGLLIDVLKDENASRGEKKRALDTLNAISPKYFGNLDLEKSKTADLDNALKGYTESLLRTAKARAALEQIVELEKQRNSLVQASEASVWQQIGNAILSGGNAAAFAQKNMATLGDNFQSTNKAIDAQIKSLTELAKSNADVSSIIAGGSGGSGGGGKSVVSAIKEVNTEYDGAIRRVGMYAQALLSLKSVQEAARLGKPLEKLPQAGGGLGVVQSLNAGNEQLSNTQQILNKLKIGAEEAAKPIGIMAQAIQAAGQAMQDAATSGEASFGKLAMAAVSSAAKIIRAWIQQGVAAAVAKALSGLPFPFNIAAGAAAGALAGGLFNKLLSSLKIPAFAEGTRNAPGGLSLVGERGPELVNLARGSQVIPNHALRGALGGGAQQLYGQFTLSRGDLILAVKSAAAEHFRSTGKNPFEVR